MGGAVVEAVEHRARFERNVAERIILAHERLDRIEVVEPHQGLELDLPVEIAPHQVDVAEAGDTARLDAGDHFVADDPLIGVRVFRRGPAAPEPADHQTRMGMSTYKAFDLSFSRRSVGAAASARWTSTVSPSISPRMSSR